MTFGRQRLRVRCSRLYRVEHMPSADGPQDPSDHETKETPLASYQTMELQLFESLVHHLIEKGILTKNDALSVVQTVAEVKRGEQEGRGRLAGSAKGELAILERLYSSFELVTERPVSSPAFDGGNVLQLRPPLHGDDPKFPKGD